MIEGRYRRAQEPYERSWWQILWLLARRQTAGGRRTDERPPWDVEAGVLLVEEAGGIVTRVRMPDGNDVYVGGNHRLHSDLARLVAAPHSPVSAIGALSP